MSKRPEFVIRFFVPGKPIPQTRPRIAGRRVMPEPDRLAAYKASMSAECNSAMSHFRRTGSLRGPILAIVRFCFAGPGRDHDAFSFQTKSDVDNLAKVVLDACQFAGAFVDDHQVAALHGYKLEPQSRTMVGTYVNLVEMDAVEVYGHKQQLLEIEWIAYRAAVAVLPSSTMAEYQR